MTLTLPDYKSKLATPVIAMSFRPNQSAKIAVINASSTSVTFTVIPGQSTFTTLKITNTGTKGAYVSTGVTTATAVASSSTPSPASGVAISNCDYIAAGAIYVQDYPAGTDTIAAICGGTDTTTLEVSIGSGQ